MVKVPIKACSHDLRMSLGTPYDVGAAKVFEGVVVDAGEAGRARGGHGGWFGLEES